MKILLVEDGLKVAKFIVQGLEESGHEVKLARDGLVGRKYATKETFDLMIFDVIVPGMTGIELCTLVRQHVALQRPF